MLAQRVRDGTIATNQVIRVEILAGCRNRQDFETNAIQLAGLVEFPIHSATWNATAELAFALRRKGVSPSLPDAVIAASALEYRATLVHADADFDRIAEHASVKIESHKPLRI